MAVQSKSSQMLRVPNDFVDIVKRISEMGRGPDSKLLKHNLDQAITSTERGESLERGLEGDALKLIQDSLPVRVVLEHPGRVSDVYDLDGEKVRVRYGEPVMLSRPQVAMLQAKVETLNRTSFDVPITLRVLP